VGGDPGTGRADQRVLHRRNAPSELVELADTVTEMRKVKHAYETGVRARRGIDF